MVASKNKKNNLRTTTRPRSKRHPERVFQQEVVKHITERIKGDVEWTHFPAGGGGARRGQFLKAMGLKPGWPDLIFVQDGLFYGLELKIGTGTLSDNQKHRHRRLSVCGGEMAVAWTLEESLKTLSTWGLIGEA